MMDIQAYVKENKAYLKHLVSTKMDVTLCIIQVGDNPASNSYIKGKLADCREVGIAADLVRLEETVTTEYLIDFIKELNDSDSIDGIIVQLPLPSHINIKKVQLAIAPKKDVDGFHPMSKFTPCTPSGVVNFLLDNNYEFKGKRALVIGRSDIVGKPLAQMLTDLNCTVTLAHSKTPSKVLLDCIENSDIVFTAINRIEYFSMDSAPYFKKVPIIIDVGLGKNSQGKLKGNLSTELVYYLRDQGLEVISGVGGIGLLTRLQLLVNTIEAKKYHK